MSDITFVKGLIPKRNENAPDYAICKLAAKKSEFIPFLNEIEGDWVNMEVMRSKAGNLYTKLDAFEPDQAQVAKQGVAQAKQKLEEFDDDSDLPF